MTVNTKLYQDKYFELIHYVYSKNHLCWNNNWTLQSWFEGGGFIDFACFLLQIPQIPKLSAFAVRDKQKEKNIETTLAYLQERIPYLEDMHRYYTYGDEDNDRRFEIIQVILEKYLFRTPLQTIMSQSNKLFEPLGISLRNKNDVYSPLYISRLLHVLSDSEVQLIDEFTPETDIDNIFCPIFEQYHIPLIINPQSFDVSHQNYLHLQIQLIFDVFKEKIESLTGEAIEVVDDFEEDTDSYSYSHKKKLKKTRGQKLDEKIDDDEKDDEKIFLKLVNYFAKDLGYDNKFYEFHEIIESGFIPKIVMHFCQIESIENVTDIDNPSLNVQIKNVEETVKFLRKHNPGFEFLLFDFKTKSKQSFSVRLLLRNIMNIYFIKKKAKGDEMKTAREEMVERFNLLTGEERNFDKLGKLYESDLLLKLAFFIVTGRADYNDYREIDDQDQYCNEHQLTSIIDFSDCTCKADERPDFADYAFYQMQILYNYIDNGRKSRLLLEKIHNAHSKFKKIKVPKFSTISSAIKAKSFVVENENEIDENEIRLDKKAAAEEKRELRHLTMKMNPNPTTYAERHKKKLRRRPSKRLKDENQVIIEPPQTFWNPDVMSSNYLYKKGVLIEQTDGMTKTESNASIEKWINEINQAQNNLEIRRTRSTTTLEQPLEMKRMPSSFEISHSATQEQLYRIFYYNEHESKWMFDQEKFKQLLKDKQIDIHGSNTPIISYIDSKENDLISLNKHVLRCDYPDFNQDPNEPEQPKEEEESSSEDSWQRLRRKNKKKKTKEEPKEEIPRDPKEIFVYALCDRTLSMLNLEIDFENKDKAAIKPIFLLLHVPEEKENIPNIRRILYEIYSFLSLISDIRIVILDKANYNSQIRNMTTLFNIVDRNIEQLMKPKKEKEKSKAKKDEEEEEDSESTSFSSSSSSSFTSSESSLSDSSLFDDEDAEFDANLGLANGFTSSLFTTESLQQIEFIENKKAREMIYLDSKIIFLINDQVIQNSDDLEESIDESEFYTTIKAKFNNKITFHYINVADHLTYKPFLDHLNDACMSLRFRRSIMINNFRCINDVSHFSSKYLDFNDNYDEISVTIKNCITSRYESMKLADKNSDPLLHLSLIQNEVNAFSPKFDLNFRNNCQNCIEEIEKAENSIDCEKLRKELNKSATEKLEYFNYQLHQRYFWTKAQLERIRRTHLNFLETEFVSILKIIGNPNITGYLYEANKNIRIEQTEIDENRLKGIFEPFEKRLIQKYSKKEQTFDQVKRKGTSYIMKETENIREVKVTLEMNTDLKAIIEQDF